MKTDCQIPVQEEYPYLIGEGKAERSKHRVLLIIAGFLLLISMSVMIAFTFQSMSEMKELRQEIEELKSKVNDLGGRLNDYQYYDDIDSEDVENDVEKFTKTPVVDKSEDFDVYDNYDDYNYDDNKSWEDVLNNNVISDTASPRIIIPNEGFTKDAKELKGTARSKRNIVGYTYDGIPINSEPFAEAIKRNFTHNIHQPATPSSPYQSPHAYSLTPGAHSYQGGPSTPRPVYSRRSRVMHQEDPTKAFRQVVKKSSLKSGDLQGSSAESSAEFTVVREDQVGSRVRHRNRHLEVLDERHPRVGRMRPLPTAHFNGDTSKYVYGQHDNFNGNGHLRHPQRTFVDWAESSWFHSLGMDRHFSFNEGVLNIKDTGLYFVYAQIYYYDEHDTNGFRVYKNDDTLLQCTTMTHSLDRVLKGNTCYTASAAYLQEGDRISLGDLSDSRYSLFEPGKSFFGVIKLGDVKVK